MATGSSDVSLAEDASAELTELLGSDDPIAIVSTPAVRQVLAATVLTSVATAPQVRIIGADRPPIETPAGPVITTTPGLVDGAIELSPYTPLAEVEELLDLTNLPEPLSRAIAAIKRVGADPSPGIVTAHPTVETALSQSIRLPTLTSDVPIEGEIVALDLAARRDLASWVTTATVFERGTAASTIESALGPTYLKDGPTTTAEGAQDVLATLAEIDPGTVIAGLLGHGWSPLLEAYQSVVDAIKTTTNTLPSGTDSEIAIAEIEEASTVATARCWAANGLEAQYGLVLAGETPTALALVAPGDRSASAVLETVVSRNGGASWGDPFVAGAIIPSRPADPTRTIMEAL